MNIRTEADIVAIVKADPWMMDVLRAAEELNLPNWWIGAGFLRNKVWDAIENNSSSPSRDVDLVYFDDVNVLPQTDWNYDEIMQAEYPFAEWEVRNQARMHYKNGFEPFTSTEDGIAHWTETATCTAVKLKAGQLAFLFCHGLDDLVNLTARPTEQFKAPEFLHIFHNRIDVKRWRERWPHLIVTED